MISFHVYEPRDGHGMAHDPLNSINRTTPDWLDIEPERWWYPESGAVQLLQSVQLQAPHRWLLQHRLEGLG